MSIDDIERENKEKFSFLEDMHLAQNSPEARINKLEKELGLSEREETSSFQRSTDPVKRRQEEEQEGEKQYEYFKELDDRSRQREQERQTVPESAGQRELEGQKSVQESAERMGGIVRGAAGGLLDAAEGTANLVISAADAADNYLAQQGFTEGDNFDERLNFADEFLPPGDSTPERASRFLTRYLVPFAGVAKLAKGATAGVRATKAVIGNAAVSAGTIDPDDERLSDLVQGVPILDNVVTDYLASDENDSEFESRLKNAAESVFVDAAAATAFMGAIKATKAGRNFKKRRAQALEEAEVKPPAREGTPEGSPQVADDAAEGAELPKSDEAKAGAIEKETGQPVSDEIPAEGSVTTEVEEPRITTTQKSLLKQYTEAVTPPKPTDKAAKKASEAMTIDEMGEALALRGDDAPDELDFLMRASKRGVVNDEQLKANAKEILNSDKEIVKLLNREFGETLNADQMGALRMLMMRDGLEVLNTLPRKPVELLDDAEIAPFIQAINKFKNTYANFRGAAGETGRAMRALQIPMEAAESGIDDITLLNKVSELVHLNGGRQGQKALISQLQGAKRGGGTRSKALIKAAQSNGISNTIKHVEDYMLSNMLASPLTLGRAYLGSGSYWASETGALALGRGWDAMTGNNAMAGDMEAHLKGSLDGLKDGLKKVKEFYKTGTAPQDVRFKFRAGERLISGQRFRSRGVQEGSFMDKALNIVGTVLSPTGNLQGADVFLSRVMRRASFHKIAHREARSLNLGYGTKEYNEFVGNLMDDPPKWMQREAQNAQETMTATRDLSDVPIMDVGDFRTGNLAAGIDKGIRSVPLARVFSPFARVSANLTDVGVQYTPMLQRLHPQVKADYMAGGARAANAKGRAMFGGAMMGLGAYMAYNGWVTGERPGLNRTRQALGKSRFEEDYVINVMGNKIRLDTLDPLALPIKFGTDIAEISGYAQDPKTQKDLGELVTLGAQRLMSHVTPDILQEGFRDLINGLENPERLRVSGAALTPWGAFMDDIREFSDPVKRQTRVQREDIESTLAWWDEQKKKIMDTIPGLSENLEPRLNLFGEPVHYPPGWGFDIASPFISNAVKDDDPLYNELLRLGMHAPVQGAEPAEGMTRFSVSMPSDTINVARGLNIPGFAKGQGVFEYKLPYNDYARLIRYSAGKGLSEENTDPVFERTLRNTTGKSYNGVPTLRKSMTDLIKSPQYKQGTDEVKKALITRLHRHYKSIGLKAFMRDLPPAAERLREQARKSRMKQLGVGQGENNDAGTSGLQIGR